jgi:GH24 family phage-related lysozyme (muramidase)
MAIDPKELRVNYKDLLSIPIRDRIKLAAQPNIGQSIIDALTPTQRAMLFPSYYKDALPDVSGFYKAMSGGLGKFNSTPATGETATYGPGGKIGRGDSSVRRSDERPQTATEINLRKEYPQFFVETSLEKSTDLIKRKEGFRATPYWDVNAWRIGFGSDTITREDGSVVSVAPGMKITEEDAARDLQRRIPDFQENGIINHVGQDAWDKLNPDTQAAITSLAYNYGSIANLSALKEAIKTGDQNQIANAVEGYAGHNGGVNADRRREEASIIRNSKAEEKTVALPDEPLNPELKNEDIEKWMATLPEKVQKQVTAALNQKIKDHGLNTVKNEMEEMKKQMLAQGKVNQVQESVALARKDPLDEDVRTALEYAATKNGVMVEVVSGGQMPLEEAIAKGATQSGKDWYLNGEKVRTGSTRHDDGGAGDVKLYRLNSEGEKEYLSMNNENDRAIMESFTTDTVSAGMTGVGAGQGYMGDQTLHIGKGTATSWGGADWIEAARQKGAENPIDIDKWKKDRESATAAATAVPASPVSVVQADATNMPANKPFSLAKGSRIDNMKQEIKKNTDTASAATPKAMPEQKLETPREDRAPVEPPPAEPAELAPQNQAAMTTGAVPPQAPVNMASDAYSGTQMGIISVSQARAYNRVGENLHRDGTSFV